MDMHNLPDHLGAPPPPRRPSHPRGTILVTTIILLLFLGLIVTGAMLSGLRDQQVSGMSVQGARARYAADSAATVALAEVMRNTDLDADGGIGSISDDSIALSDPTLATTRYWSTVLAAPTGNTLELHAANADAERTVQISLGGTGVGTAAPMLVYASSDDGRVPLITTLSDGVWGAPSAALSLADPMNQVAMAQSPAGSLALLLTSGARAVTLVTRTAPTAAWDAARTMTLDCGTAYRPVAALAYEQSSGDLLIAYRVGAATTIRTRLLTSGGLSPESTLDLGLATPVEDVQLVRRPGSDAIVLLARAGATIVGSYWTGTAFGPPTTLTTIGTTQGRPMAAAFETHSGEGLVVYSEGKAIRARTIVGGVWSAPFLAGNGGKNVMFLRLAPRPTPDSDVILAGYSDGTGVVAAIPWNGAAFGTKRSMDGSRGFRGAEQRFDLAWQPDGARAVVAWARAGESIVRRQTWNGTRWTRSAVGPTLGSSVRRVALGRGGTGTQVIMAGLLAAPSPAIADYLVYGGGGLTPGTIRCDGNAGAGAPGITMPTAPGGAIGSGSATYAKNTTISIPPGSYNNYTFKNKDTINLTRGTYFFNTFNVAARTTITINADTAGGDVDLVIASGGLSPGNGFVVRSTGGGCVNIHVRTGNVAIGNNAVLEGVNLRVYDGSISIGKSVDFYGSLWASGTVTLSTGFITPDPSLAPSAGALVAIPFDSGSPGVARTISTSARGAPMWAGFGMGSSEGQAARINGWAMVGW